MRKYIISDFIALVPLDSIELIYENEENITIGGSTGYTLMFIIGNNGKKEKHVLLAPNNSKENNKTLTKIKEFCEDKNAKVLDLRSGLRDCM